MLWVIPLYIVSSSAPHSVRPPVITRGCIWLVSDTCGLFVYTLSNLTGGSTWQLKLEVFSHRLVRLRP